MASGGRLTYEATNGTVFRVRAASEDSYEIRVEPGGLRRLSDHLIPLVEGLACTNLFVVSDANVLWHHRGVLLAQLERLGLPTTVHSIEGGEKSKNLSSVLALWEAFDESSVRRRSLILSVGGGVVSDIAGFAANGYLRGLPLALVPTTLLAQVDAAIGGKNGVTHFGKKNRIGSFHHPRLVLVDPEALRTLPSREMSEGMAEATKIAYLTSDPAVRWLRRVGRAGAWSATVLPEVISSSIERKLQLLHEDPYESQGLDRALNLGHCFGHAVEEVLGYELEHGSAVAIGMSLAGQLGVLRGLAPSEEHQRLRSLLEGFGLPIALDPEHESPTWAALDSVRDVRNGRLRPVIPIRPGIWTYGDDITEGEWRKICGAARS